MNTRRPDVFRLMRDWAAPHRSGNVTTAQFIDAPSPASGLELGHFIDVWLDQPDEPTSRSTLSAAVGVHRVRSARARVRSAW